MTISDLVYKVSDQELRDMRSLIDKHLRWRKEHHRAVTEALHKGICVCGALLGEGNEIIDRGYVFGIECKKCK